MNTQNELLTKLDKYLAMRDAALAIKNDASFADELLQDCRTYIASKGWLEDAVIVLEEGAEPMVGDVIQDISESNSNNFYVIRIPEALENGKYLEKTWPAKIIQRNGKSVIYKPTPTEASDAE
jgi:hypothetical protein